MKISKLLVTLVSAAGLIETASAIDYIQRFLYNPVSAWGENLALGR